MTNETSDIRFNSFISEGFFESTLTNYEIKFYLSPFMVLFTIR